MLYLKFKYSLDEDIFFLIRKNRKLTKIYIKLSMASVRIHGKENIWGQIFFSLVNTCILYLFVCICMNFNFVCKEQDWCHSFSVCFWRNLNLEECKPILVVFEVNTLFCIILTLDIFVELNIFIELISKGNQLCLACLSF